jgi:hypothetical protein
MHNEELKQFMPGETRNKILELLCDYLLPVHVDIVTEFELSPKDKTTRLADAVNDYNSNLGASTYL